MVNLDCRWLVNQRQVYLPTVPKHICLVNSPHLYQVKANYFCAFKIWLAFWTYCISQPLLQMKGNNELRRCFIFNISLISLKHPEMTGTSLCRWTFARISSSYSPGAAFAEFPLSSITCLFPLFLCFYAQNLKSWHFHLWFHHLISQCAMTETFFQDSLKKSYQCTANY